MVALTRREWKITVKCQVCGTSHRLLVDMNDMVAWKSGKYIQEAMPYLSVDERELLISLTCGDCFEEMFGNCEE